MVDFFPVLRFLPSWFPGVGRSRYLTILRSVLNDVLPSGFKRAVEETRVVVQKAMDLPFEMVKKAMVSYLLLVNQLMTRTPKLTFAQQAEGTAVPSFTSTLLLDKGTGSGFTEDFDIRSAAGVLYAAGADTVNFSLHFSYERLLANIP